jgi:ABC-type branched-subunit amino acid transport system ATPase component/MFS family permease
MGADDVALDSIEQIEQEARELTERSLAALGFDSSEAVPTLGVGIRRAGATWTTVVRATLLVLPVMFLTLVLLRFDSSVANTLGLDPLGYEYPGLLNSLVIPVFVAGFAAAALVGAHLMSRHMIRPRVLLLGSLALAGGMWLASFSTSEVALVAAMAVTGAGAGAIFTAAFSMVMDAYPPDVRERVIALVVFGLAAGTVIANVVILVGFDHFDLTWRGCLMVLSCVATAAALGAFGLRDGGVGTYDVDRIAAIVRERVGERGDEKAELSEADVAVKFGEQMRAVLTARSGTAMAIVFALAGTLAVPMQAFVSQFVVARYQWGFVDRQWLFIFLGTVAMVPLFFLFARGDAWFRKSPAKLLTAVARLALLGALSLVVMAFWANGIVTIVTLALAYLGLYFSVAVAYLVWLSVVDPRLRPQTAAIAGLLIASAVLVGGVLAGQLSDRYGITTAMVFFALNYLGVSGATRVSSREMARDVARLVEQETEREELLVRVSSGQHFPLLGVRNLDFSYGKLQVLFGVDFTVDDGEIVALLGTNGAGKSTLLKVISGIGKPTRGTVHFRGADITYVDPARRVGYGIAQMPGGRSVFPGMSVVENLRMCAFTLRKSSKAVARGIDATFDAFPALAARRNQGADTLSGGEQQMLALGRAFILQPRLLLIDELSLGLAPLIVGQLIAMVKRINADGTAVVVVEQSVNIALTLVDHAYFMERGQMRFDGAAPELVARPDLLRSVFLEGASKGLEAMSAAPADNGAGSGVSTERQTDPDSGDH